VLSRRKPQGDEYMGNQALNGHGIRVRIYFGERDRFGQKALWSALLEFLSREDVAGATVLRGVAGYGAHSKIHTALILDLSTDLPLVLEWIDTEGRVSQLLPHIEAMLQASMITTDPVTIVRYQHHIDRE
jgi:PII-like signaling protein